jgi:two-component system response regulator MtrA
MSFDYVDTVSGTIVLVIGSARELSGAALAGLTATGAMVARFPTSTAAVEWLVQQPGPDRVLRLGRLEIDREQRTASQGGARLGLTEQEIDLLLALAEAPGRRLAFRDLDQKVWGDRHRHDTQRIRSAIKRLRRKLAAAEVRCALQAVRGHGFRLVILREPEAGM